MMYAVDLWSILKWYCKTVVWDDRRDDRQLGSSVLQHFYQTLERNNRVGSYEGFCQSKLTFFYSGND